MKSKSAKVNGSAGSRWRWTRFRREWKVPLGQLVEAADQFGAVLGELRFAVGQ
jgi:hypothetical protein